MLKTSPADIRVLILHAVGDGTAYRLSTSTPIPGVTRKVQSLLDRVYSPSAEIQAEARKWRIGVLHLLALGQEVALFENPLALRDESRKWGLDGNIIIRGQRSLRPFFHQISVLEAGHIAPLVQMHTALMVNEGDLRVHVDGSLSLTKKTIAEAVDLRSSFEGTSVTHAWVTATVIPSYLERLYSNLKSRCLKSVIFGEIKDLVHNWLARILRKDGLRTRLARGQSPPPSSIKAWVYNAALSHFRDGGRDALTRGLKGCRTEKDLVLANEGVSSIHHDTVDRSIPSSVQGVFLSTGEDGKTNSVLSHGSENAPLLDTSGGDLSDEIIHYMTARQGLARIESFLQDNKSESAARLQRVFRQLVDDDCNLREIAQAEGVSRTRAAAIVSNIRAIACAGEKRDTPPAQKITVRVPSPMDFRVMRYVNEWPRITAKDMKEPQDILNGENVGGMGERIPATVLARLVQDGWLAKTTTGRFIITRAGKDILQSEDVTYASKKWNLPQERVHALMHEADSYCSGLKNQRAPQRISQSSDFHANV